MIKSLLTGLTAALVLATNLSAAPADLGVGDQAPALDHVEWIKGEPVSRFEPGRVYVLDFWATWCGPCVRSIPHINELALARKDAVSVIGVAIWPTETMTPTAEYVAAKGDEMSYLIAADVEGATAAAYMEASGQNGIPTCMVVDQQGRIAWIGHPMAGLEDVVGQVVDGTWDIEAARAEFAKKAEEARRREELNAKASPIFMAMRQAAEGEDWDKAAELALELAELDPIFANFTVQRYGFLRTGGHEKEAREYALSLVTDSHKDDAPFLNMLAWSIASPDNLDETKDLDLAQRAAERAVAITKSKDADVLDTLARVHAAKGDFAKAVEIQEQAVAAAPEAMRENLAKTLESYEAGAALSQLGYVGDESEGEDG